MACHTNLMFIELMQYPDDMIFVLPSVGGLQLMLDCCCSEISMAVGIAFNCSNSSCISFGSLHKQIIKILCPTRLAILLVPAYYCNVIILPSQQQAITAAISLSSRTARCSGSLARLNIWWECAAIDEITCTITCHHRWINHNKSRFDLSRRVADHCSAGDLFLWKHWTESRPTVHQANEVLYYCTRRDIISLIYLK